jgi:Domain of unknown function (DUF5127)
VTYVTWRVQSSDSETHDVAVYFDAASQIVVNTPDEPVSWSRYRVGDLQVLRMGSQQQAGVVNGGWGELARRGQSQ